MADMEQIVILGDGVTFMNKGEMSIVTVQINLFHLRERIRQFSHVYAKLEIRLPIIEKRVNSFIKTERGRAYEVKELEGNRWSILLTLEFPQKIDEKRRQETTTKLQLTYYTKE